jgi:hypothetical protein
MSVLKKLSHRLSQVEASTQATEQLVCDLVNGKLKKKNEWYVLKRQSSEEGPFRGTWYFKEWNKTNAKKPKPHWVQDLHKAWKTERKDKVEGLAKAIREMFPDRKDEDEYSCVLVTVDGLSGDWYEIDDSDEISRPEEDDEAKYYALVSFDYPTGGREFYYSGQTIRGQERPKLLWSKNLKDAVIWDEDSFDVMEEFRQSAAMSKQRPLEGVGYITLRKIPNPPNMKGLPRYEPINRLFNQKVKSKKKASKKRKR